MPAMQEIKCLCGCGRKKDVRKADIKRGWGKFFSKSCKAKYQEKRTGQHREHIDRVIDPNMDDDDIGHPMQSGYFGHGQE